MRILKILAAILAGFLGLVGLTIGVARASLPNTACSVNKEQVDELVLETMSYADVKAALSCDGILKTREDFGGNELVLETHSWRGNAWPYGKFSGEFINGTLHGTEQYWLNLELSGNKD